MSETNGDIPRMTDRALNAEAWRIENRPSITLAGQERLNAIEREIAARNAAYAALPRQPMPDCVCGHTWLAHERNGPCGEPGCFCDGYRLPDSAPRPQQ